jgi:primosomal protein N' (replication factor Y)
MPVSDCKPGYAFADIYTDTPADGYYTYRIPENMNILPGMRVIIDFSGRKMTGYVIAVHDTAPVGFELKDIIGRIDDEPVFDDRLLRLSEYVADSYVSSTGEALAKALPSGESSKSRMVRAGAERTDGHSNNLTLKQKEIYNRIKSSPEKAHLIFGITGSGKTEIYIESARDAVSQGMSVIYLVPEIGLSAQIQQRLYRVFGDTLVLYHSSLTRNQRLLNWKKFYKGRAMVAVGTRSAVFLQCPKLGLIIIDEEHDPSYKEQSTPRYNARRIAFHRSVSENARLILGSATPSVETLHAAENGIIELHRLDERYGEGRLPAIEIVKLNKTGEAISPRLKLFTSRAVQAGMQAVYLLNRRGFAPFVLCGDCGSPVECPNCSIGMNYHRDRGMLCHYCGHSCAFPEKCSKCGSESMQKLGSGTQKIEDLISREFPGFRVFRLDQDSARKKDTVYDLLDMMNGGEVDILLGTQMVSKGFDFHKVTVAGIILADIGLNMPDFRATEKIFSLLMQLSGRTGRGDSKGRVIIQTFNDRHMIFNFLKNHDYWGFYREELKIRKMINYPPFSRLARIVMRGKSEKDVIETADLFAVKLKKNLSGKKTDISLLGPSPAPLMKIGSNYRYHIILKSRKLNDLKELIKNTIASFKARTVFVEVDIDPVDML